MRTKFYILTLATASLVLAGCKKEQNVPERDWDNTNYIVSTNDEPLQGTYYKPYAGFCGDPMPFFDPVAKNFKIYYLQDYRPNPEATYHPIWGIETRNAASYTSLGEVLPCGAREEQDAALGTGSVIYNADQKTYYFFYTGHKYLPTSEDNGEAVMFATSKDAKHWTKNNVFVLRGSDYGYSANDFRDPEVFLLEDGYHMLVATLEGSQGVFAHFVSADCQTWEHKGRYCKMHWDRFEECPNVFQMGNYWYLIYSDKADFDRKVHYFMASSFSELATKVEGAKFPDGLTEGSLDGKAFYAGKTASDGTNRYIWGWCPTRKGKDNTKAGEADLEWAGNLVCHQIIQHEDGKLTLGAIKAVADKYNQLKHVNATSLDLKEGEGKLMERMGYHTHLSFTLTAGSAADVFAISLIRSADNRNYYNLVFNPEDGNSNRKINFEKEDKVNEHGDPDRFIAGADSYKFPTPADNVYHVEIFTDNSVFVMYVNNNVCYTNRIYGMSRNCWSINCFTGTLKVSDIKHYEY